MRALSSAYYASRPPTRATMLGGIEHVHDEDVRGSVAFIEALRTCHSRPPRSGTALDCGAGIGRVSAAVLVPALGAVELVEPNGSFLAEAAKSLAPAAVRAVHAVALEDFAPPAGSTYELVWAQWVLGYVDDEALITLLRRCAALLAPGGCIVVKESVTRGGGGPMAGYYDASDGSTTRSEERFCQCFASAGLRVLSAQLQTGFPPELFPVVMFALVARSQA